MVKYSLEEVKKATLEYFNGDSLAVDVWVKKYALKDSHGNIYELSPDDMHKRLAKEFARIEAKYPNPLTEDEIYELFKNFKYLVPQGSPCSAIGNPFQLQSASNCFVLESPYDSYSGILFTDRQIANLCKHRGGTGFSISNIRPKNLPVNNAAGTTDGIGIFMERFSNTVREVAQSGRRGALMMSISSRHPEIETFIDIKQDKTKVTGANISIQFDDAFFEALNNNTNYTLKFPVDSDNPIITKEVSAKKLWDKFINAATNSGEPGCMFQDTIDNNSSSHAYGIKDKRFKNISSNPCSEIVMGIDSCRLLAINLFSYVLNPFTKNSKFDIELFEKHSKIAQRITDDLVDLELEIIDKIIEKKYSDPEPDYIKVEEINMWKTYKDTAKLGRRTGVGITGLGDTIAAIGYTYGDLKSIELTDQIYKTLAKGSFTESINMAVDRGAFELYDYEIDKDIHFMHRILNILDEDTKITYLNSGRRNVSLLTTAPVGSMSMMTGTTSGIESVFLPFYKRRKKIAQNEISYDFIDAKGDKWKEFDVYHHNYKLWMDISGETAYEKSPYYKATANDINWLDSVTIQSTAQYWVDHSISKTVNLPKGTSNDVVSKVYMKAWETGCKGITVYVDGSRDGVLISNDKPKEISKRHKIERPKELPCDIHHVTANGTKYYVIVGLIDEKPYELFCFSKKHISIPPIKKEGKLIKVEPGIYNLQYNGTIIENITEHFESPEEDAFTRVVSRMLRNDIPVAYICEDLDKSYSNITSFYKAISRTLKKNYMTDAELNENLNGIKCPECGNKLTFVEGCVSCINCSWSKCS